MTRSKYAAHAINLCQPTDSVSPDQDLTPNVSVATYLQSRRSTYDIYVVCPERSILDHFSTDSRPSERRGNLHSLPDLLTAQYEL